MVDVLAHGLHPGRGILGRCRLRSSRSAPRSAWRAETCGHVRSQIERARVVARGAEHRRGGGRVRPAVRHRLGALEPRREIRVVCRRDGAIGVAQRRDGGGDGVRRAGAEQNRLQEPGGGQAEGNRPVGVLDDAHRVRAAFEHLGAPREQRHDRDQVRDGLVLVVVRAAARPRPARAHVRHEASRARVVVARPARRARAGAAVVGVVGVRDLDRVDEGDGVLVGGGRQRSQVDHALLPERRELAGGVRVPLHLRRRVELGRAVAPDGARDLGRRVDPVEGHRRSISDERADHHGEGAVFEAAGHGCRRVVATARTLRRAPRRKLGEARHPRQLGAAGLVQLHKARGAQVRAGARKATAAVAALSRAANSRHSVEVALLQHRGRARRRAAEAVRQQLRVAGRERGEQQRGGERQLPHHRGQQPAAPNRAWVASPTAAANHALAREWQLASVLRPRELCPAPQIER